MTTSYPIVFLQKMRYCFEFWSFFYFFREYALGDLDDALRSLIPTFTTEGNLPHAVQARGMSSSNLLAAGGVASYNCQSMSSSFSTDVWRVKLTSI